MRLVVLFGLFLLISGIYPVKAQFHCDDKQQMCKVMQNDTIAGGTNNLQGVHITNEQIDQEKQNLLFMINFAMRGVSSNNAEKNMRENKSFCDFLRFSVPKGIFTPSGYSSITCMKNTLQLDFSHSSKKDFSVWDEASIGYNLKLEADEYQKRIKLTPQDFTDILDLQFIKKQADNYELKEQKQYYYRYYYQWKLNSSIKVKVITPNNVLINNEQYPEYINSIYITHEGNMKSIPSK